MRRVNKVIFLLFLAVAISACSSTIYIPPENGPTAKLIFPSKKSSYKLLGGFSSSGSSFAIAGKDGCGKFVKVEKSDTSEAKNIIPANKVIFVNSGYSFGNRHCSVTGSFLPKENHTYTVEPQLINGGCSVAVKNNEENKFVKLNRAKVDIWVGQTVCPIKNKI